MSAHFQEEQAFPDECANCGGREDLALCSRCHSAHFCSRKCQKAYWPFHKEWCKRNDFADHVEKTQPKFARFLRKHGKQAVLKDDEVDRVERKVVSVADMYGDANPKPKPPNFDAEDMRKMKLADERRLMALRDADRHTVAARVAGGAVAGAAAIAWGEIEVAEGLGVDDDAGLGMKWRQNQTFVEVFVLLPTGCPGSRVDVKLETDRIRVTVKGEDVIRGELYAPIKAEASTWLIADGVLELSLLKRNRRGNYENGSNNAETFWFSVVREDGGRRDDAAGDAPSGYGRPAIGPPRVASSYPPNEYYESAHVAAPEGDGPGYKGRASSNRPMIKNKPN